MNLLAIDTSTAHASVALEFNGVMYVEEAFEIREHARVLLAMVERVLAQAGTTLGALDALVFGEGPGSFTGLRIACSVTKGLAYAHDLPVYPVGSLFAIAFAARKHLVKQDISILAMMDARMHQVYWMFDPLSKQHEAHVSDAEAVHVSINTPLCLAGVGYEAYLDTLPLGIRDALVSTHTVYPRADTMIHAVNAGGISAVAADAAMPAYVRQQVTGG